METLQFFVGLAQNAGAASGPIFAVLWILERNDRRSIQRERDALLERTLKGLTDAGTALNALVSGTSDNRAALSAVAATVAAIATAVQALAPKRRR